MPFSVMPSLVLGIHVLKITNKQKDVDGREEPSHDAVDDVEQAAIHPSIGIQSSKPPVPFTGLNSGP
jgi:hypothetical protein